MLRAILWILAPVPRKEAMKTPPLPEWYYWVGYMLILATSLLLLFRHIMRKLGH
jgi:hypothetical protein